MLIKAKAGRAMNRFRPAEYSSFCCFNPSRLEPHMAVYEQNEFCRCMKDAELTGGTATDPTVGSDDSEIWRVFFKFKRMWLRVIVDYDDIDQISRCFEDGFDCHPRLVIVVEGVEDYGDAFLRHVNCDSCGRFVVISYGAYHHCFQCF